MSKFKKCTKLWCQRQYIRKWNLFFTTLIYMQYALLGAVCKNKHSHLQRRPVFHSRCRRWNERETSTANISGSLWRNGADTGRMPDDLCSAGNRGDRWCGLSEGLQWYKSLISFYCTGPWRNLGQSHYRKASRTPPDAYSPACLSSGIGGNTRLQSDVKPVTKALSGKKSYHPRYRTQAFRNVRPPCR